MDSIELCLVEKMTMIHFVKSFLKIQQDEVNLRLFIQAFCQVVQCNQLAVPYMILSYGLGISEDVMFGEMPNYCAVNYMFT